MNKQSVSDDIGATPLRILLIEQDQRNRDIMAKALDKALHFSSELKWLKDFESAVEAIAGDSHDVCLLGCHVDSGDSLEILAEAVAAGWRAPVILLVDEDYPEFEREPRDLGAADYLVWSQVEPNMVKRSIRYALARKADENKLRDTKEDLIRRLIDLQDTKDRVEKQSEQYVTMVEELALAKNALEKLNLEKDKLFSIIAHDLRSPFTSLLGFSEMIAIGSDKMSTEQIVEYTKTINESGKRVFQLLENLLEWARVQMDGVKYDAVDFELSALVGQSIDVLASVAGDKKLTLTNSVSCLTVHADHDMIDTVIRNLINNALKFTPEGGAVDVSAATVEGGIEVSVTDTGRGMSADQVSSLFDLGTNSSTPGTNDEKGTGLGLLLCKDLVELNKGTLSVESEPGKGSTFRFTLPAS